MELCDGNLHSYVKEMPQTDPKLDRVVIGQVVVALNYLHEKKIIHKDLNPNNILFKGTTCKIPLMKLADFGFSRELPKGKNSFNPTKNKGTRGYVAPELKTSGKPSFASDVWALGAVVYFIVTRGDHPYRLVGEIEDIIDRSTLIAKLKNAPNIYKVSDWSAADLISRLLNYEPNRRPKAFHVLLHPFFLISNEPAKSFLTKYLGDSYATNFENENALRFKEMLQESKIRDWYENLDADLKNEEDVEALANISSLVGS